MPDQSIKALFDVLDVDPRPEFVAALRRRIEIEAGESAQSRASGQHPGSDGSIVQLDSAGSPGVRRLGLRRMVAAGLAVASLILVLVALVVRSGNDETPAITPVTVPATTSELPSPTTGLPAPTTTELATPTTTGLPAPTTADLALTSLPATEAVGARLQTTIPVANTAESIAIADDAVWVSGWDGTVVARIDAETNDVITVDVGKPGTIVTVGEGGVWVGVDGGLVLRLDPDTGEVIATIDIGSPSRTIAVPGFGAVWVWTPGEAVVSRIDPQSNQVTATVELAARGLVPGGGEMWALTCDSVAGGQLVSFDPQTLIVDEPIALDECGNALGFADESLWVGLPGGRTGRVDPTDRKIEAVLDVGPDGNAPFLTARDGQVWRPLSTSVVARIDTASNTVAEILDLGRTGQTAGFAVGHGSLWAGNYGDQTVLRIDP